MKTIAARILDALGIPYELRDYDPGGEHISAEEVARRVTDDRLGFMDTPVTRTGARLGFMDTPVVLTDARLGFMDTPVTLTGLHSRGQ